MSVIRKACKQWPFFVLLVLLSSAALAHNPLNSEGQDRWAGLVTATLLLLFWALYTRGYLKQLAGWQRGLAFHLTSLLALMTLLGPLDEWAKTSTTAHMTQHMLLMVVIAPIWVLCRPLAQLSTGGGRRLQVIWRPGLRLAGHPLYAAYLHGAVIWFWHMPYFYMLAVNNVWWHAFEHACFLLSAGVFWWAVLHAGKRRTPWGLIALLFTLMHTGLLGALLTFAREPLYGEARSLQDQQLAGLIMWVAAAVPYLLASAWIGYRWFQRLLR